jgi:hypothetical protein
MDEREEFPTIEVEIIKPTADEVSEGFRNLQMCWPTWKDTPGLLVTSEDDLGLIVSAVEYEHDDLGFVLKFAIREKLFALSDFDDEEYSVGFGWNQPYLFFDQNGISAPYAYYLHFEHAGVERARELYRAFADIVGDLPSPRSLRRCFGPDGAEYYAEMMSRLKEHPDAG